MSLNNSPGTPAAEVLQKLDWQKGNGLLPAVVQDADNGTVLMLAYMNAESLRLTLKLKRLTFYSRSRKELWTKGETSGNTLEFVDITTDCDADTLLVRARPTGPVCHLGRANCFDTPARSDDFIDVLERIIAQRADASTTQSYTADLLQSGTLRIAQKVGEEAVEVALAATQADDDAFIDESADLLFHLMVLLRSKHLNYSDVVDRLQARHDARSRSGAGH